MDNVEILEWMIKEYDKRGGGHSQKEALKEAVTCMKHKRRRWSFGTWLKGIKFTWKF